ncbi:hypothetical protein WQE_43754 [Paraburkholderia hospita]|uniref:Uncharacterized protein n=1 Tax=Paraburkholderia hospita TaxID=169430 RepID=A0ABP2PA20_9BURK|nr:hypothetical protein WQE_43754 [Paraburkholderia hospita]
MPQQCLGLGKPPGVEQQTSEIRIPDPKIRLEFDNSSVFMFGVGDAPAFFEQIAEVVVHISGFMSQLDHRTQLFNCFNLTTGFNQYSLQVNARMHRVGITIQCFTIFYFCCVQSARLVQQTRQVTACHSKAGIDFQSASKRFLRLRIALLRL